MTATRRSGADDSEGRALPAHRQPRLADVIADKLRERILNGELTDGQLLPRQEDLLVEFGVSAPSLRGALQVLETEGLVTVLRGSIGGVRVRTPRARGVAYNAALVLQAERVSLLDVAVALEHLEPACVQLCAGRADRSETVVPLLREAHEATLRDIDDLDAATQHARRFHELLASLCGNATVLLLVGALEALWSAHEQRWVAEMARRGDAPGVTERAANAQRHAEIIDAIEAGDVETAGRLSREHLRGSRGRSLGSPDAVVRARTLWA